MFIRLLNIFLTVDHAKKGQEQRKTKMEKV